MLKYTLLWIISGLVVAVIIIFPSLLNKFTSIFGIASEMNGLFAFCILFIIAILMSLTSIVSRQNNKLKILTQTLAMQEKRIRELENAQEQDKTAKGLYNEK